MDAIDDLVELARRVNGQAAECAVFRVRAEVFNPSPHREKTSYRHRLIANGVPTCLWPRNVS